MRDEAFIQALKEMEDRVYERVCQKLRFAGTWYYAKMPRCNNPECECNNKGG